MYKTFPISISIDAETMERIERLTNKLEMSRSALIRHLVELADTPHTLVDSREEYQES